MSMQKANGYSAKRETIGKNRKKKKYNMYTDCLKKLVIVVAVLLSFQVANGINTMIKEKQAEGASENQAITYMSEYDMESLG